MTPTPRTRQRRQRRIYAAIAGWALLGAASTGIVACSSADAAGSSSTSAAAGSGGAAAGSASSSASSSAVPSSSTAGSSPAAASSAATPDPTAAAAPAATAEAAPSTAAEAAAAGAYADGIYTATGSYSSPGGEESITVTLTLAGDVVTDASAVGDAAGPPSSQFQEQFVSNFAELVIGKNIDEVSLDKVAGSSLTPMGFNAAVETIKSDALA